MYTCPVCFCDDLEDAPKDYAICHCCGTEFGEDDVCLTHEELRAQWVSFGAPWFFGAAPVGWSHEVQLRRGLRGQNMKGGIEC